MDSGYYAACTALMTRVRALDTIANNLANSGTAGYRGQHNVFQSVLATATSSASSPLNQAVNSFGVMTGTRLDAEQGNLESTGNDNDLAIEGPGYFTVQTPAGTVYTRAGNFRISSSNQLLTAAGDPVLGDAGPIEILDHDFSVSGDGTISSGGALSGRLKIVEFPPGTELENIGQTYFRAPDGAAQPSTNTQVRQGMLEDANVSPIGGVVELISVQRQTEMMQHVLAMINSELNKVATQDLPRVSG